MSPKFGTSGLRGLVTELTADCVRNYVNAFVSACNIKTDVWIGHDLRCSSPTIAQHVSQALRAQKINATLCGTVTTPALASAAMNAGAASIMVTGSHIPDDRNGLKFYTCQGEITKANEYAIRCNLQFMPENIGDTLHFSGRTLTRDDIGILWQNRYINAFNSDALAGLRIGVWMHSSVGSDDIVATLSRLGADVVPLDRRENFLPIDTEAIDETIRDQFKHWAIVERLDAIVSSDGDGDRPLVADERGRIIPGDILGQITSKFLNAKSVVTPVSSNTGIEDHKDQFRVIRTQIGSPYVLSAMQSQSGDVVGYEGNGGFILGFEANLPKGSLLPLMTRDCLLPILATLCEAKKVGSLERRVAAEPQRFTATKCIRHIPTMRSKTFLTELAHNLTVIPHAKHQNIKTINHTDGLRIVFDDDRIVHYRPSGNAPEFRCYVETESLHSATALLSKHLTWLHSALS